MIIKTSWQAGTPMGKEQSGKPYPPPSVHCPPLASVHSPPPPPPLHSPHPSLHTPHPSLHTPLSPNSALIRKTNELGSH